MIFIDNEFKMKGSQSDLIWSNEVKQLGQIDIG